MSAPVTSISRRATPLLVGLGAVLAAGNWYLEPERVRSWAAALLFLACLALASWLASRRSASPSAPRHAADSIQSGVVFAALIITVSLSTKLAHALGKVDDADLSQRLSMVVLGAFLAFTGNAMPKLLMPLSALKCDVASVQAVQRFAGWTWVLTGLAFAAAWLVLPPDIAKPVSVALMVGGALAVMVRALRFRRRHQEES